MTRYLRHPNYGSYRPDPARLAEADVLDDWVAIPSRAGDDGLAVIGRNGDGDSVETADLHVLDAEAGYCVSNGGLLYRLGRRRATVLQMPRRPSDETVAERVAKIVAALDDRDRIRDGWRPGEAELQGAPALWWWSYATHPGVGIPALDGQPREQVHVSEMIRWTSPLAALQYDGERGWARTWNGWHQLEKRMPSYGEDVAPLSNRAEFYTSNVRAECIEPLLKLPYFAPPIRLHPTAELYEGEHAEWREIWRWIEDNHGARVDQAFGLFVAMRTGRSPAEAYLWTDEFAKTRLGLRGYN